MLLVSVFRLYGRTGVGLESVIGLVNNSFSCVRALPASAVHFHRFVFSRSVIGADIMVKLSM